MQQPPNQPTHYPQQQPPKFAPQGQYGAFSPQQPPIQPPKKKGRKGLWIALGILVVATALCGIISIATSQTTTSPGKQNMQSSTPKPTQKASTLSVTHGTPRFGGLYTDFLGRYGQPWGAASNKNFWIDRAHTMFISVGSINNSKVTAMSVIGNPSWSRKQTETYCKQFLPSDANEFNRVDTSMNILIDYHSIAGEVIMRIADQGTCTLNGPQS